jgi:hypothetical protein
VVRSRCGLGLGKRSLEKVGWMESMKGVAVILSYQHYNQKRKKMVKGKMGRETMGKDNMEEAETEAKAGRVEPQKAKEQRVNDNKEEGGKYREDVFGDTLPGCILDVLFPRHFNFIIRIPHIRVEHQYRITNNEDLIMRVPQSGVGSIVFLREEFDETINRALFFW